ncbi:MAG: flagellar type III secretion system pore protein FliP [Oscillibacter sp.]|uniref:flagellar type III secretion system pore protein FliP n=1 Tax=uncultured Oscillibacter sp. TaxID=876091 RepID=UPI002171D05C|nr:flagellar type III secretion system pore protein FliP [uncultured Oscillibacter sp.]MCI8801754.1 flagellar type III secretion system pore protein FliP [Oscillibacter sp.]
MPDALINVNGESVQALEILFLTTMITLLPSLVVMMTSFTRFIISFSFLRTAMGTQQTPPNLVLVGMALFLTLFTMSPVFSQIKTEAYDPYIAEEIDQEEFFRRAEVPLKDFMARNTKVNTLEMYCDLAKVEMPDPVNTATVAEQVPLRVLAPAFVTCELQTAFTYGLLLYIPFMLIDIVVSCTLMSMGMIMLPPSMISAPFKLLLFVSLNGWELLFSTLVRTFN